MNSHIIFKSIGILLLILGITMALCVAVAAALPVSPNHNASLALDGWVYAIGITLASSTLLLLLARLVKRSSRRADAILRKEAIALVGIAWLVCSAHAALPYLFCEPTLPLDKAVFEGVSGLTTTGATVLPDIEAVSKTVLLWRSATQWLGGMGILAMFVLVLSGIGASGRMMFGAESSLHSSDLTLSNIRQTTRSLWTLYIALTIVCCIGMLALGLTPFQAINHSLTTTATGGFGTENDSIDSFSSPLKIWIMIFMLICGISFPLYLVLLKRRQWEDLRNHEETWVFLAIIVAATAFMMLGHGSGALDASHIDIMFNVVSISTTTGYSVADYGSWPLTAREVMFALMVIGGCSGSTAGGLKVSRLILWIRFCRSELTRAFRPQMVQRPMLNKRPVPDGMLGQLFVVLTAAAFLLIAGTMLIHIFEPATSSAGCFSAVSSCLLNIGPAFAEFGPTKSFAEISAPTSVMLSCLMIFGRLEYVAVFVLFSRKLWRRY